MRLHLTSALKLTYAPVGLCGNAQVDGKEECDRGADCSFTCECAPGTRPVGRSGSCQGKIHSIVAPS